jgi:hypothetical protein
MHSSWGVVSLEVSTARPTAFTQGHTEKPNSCPSDDLSFSLIHCKKIIAKLPSSGAASLQ